MHVPVKQNTRVMNQNDMLRVSCLSAKVWNLAFLRSIWP